MPRCYMKINAVKSQSNLNYSCDRRISFHTYLTIPKFQHFAIYALSHSIAANGMKLALVKEKPANKWLQYFVREKFLYQNLNRIY